MTPRGSPDCGSRVAQNVEAAGPTAIATRSAPVGATARAASSATAPVITEASNAAAATIFLNDMIRSSRLL